MEPKTRKIFNNHRKLNEIGGILLGIGVGSLLAQQLLKNNPLLSTIQVLSAVGGFTILVYEQRKWKRYKNK